MAWSFWRQEMSPVETRLLPSFTTPGMRDLIHRMSSLTATSGVSSAYRSAEPQAARQPGAGPFRPHRSHKTHRQTKRPLRRIGGRGRKAPCKRIGTQRVIFMTTPQKHSCTIHQIRGNHIPPSGGQSVGSELLLGKPPEDGHPGGELAPPAGRVTRSRIAAS